MTRPFPVRLLACLLDYHYSRIDRARTNILPAGMYDLYSGQRWKVRIV